MFKTFVVLEVRTSLWTAGSTWTAPVLSQPCKTMTLTFANHHAIEPNHHIEALCRSPVYFLTIPITSYLLWINSIRVVDGQPFNWNSNKNLWKRKYVCSHFCDWSIWFSGVAVTGQNYTEREFVFEKLDGEHSRYCRSASTIFDPKVIRAIPSLKIMMHRHELEPTGKPSVVGPDDVVNCLRAMNLDCKIDGTRKFTTQLERLRSNCRNEVADTYSFVPSYLRLYDQWTQFMGECSSEGINK